MCDECVAAERLKTGLIRHPNLNLWSVMAGMFHEGFLWRELFDYAPAHTLSGGTVKPEYRHGPDPRFEAFIESYYQKCPEARALGQVEP